jgi:hypothetical protein
MIAIVHDVVGLLRAPMGIYYAYLVRISRNLERDRDFESYRSTNGSAWRTRARPAAPI